LKYNNIQNPKKGEKMSIPWKLAACIDAGVYDSKEEIIELCKYANIDALETNWRYTENREKKDIEGIGDNFRKQEIELYSFHLPFTQEDDISCFYETKRKEAIKRLVPSMEQASALGAKALVLHPTTNHFDVSVEGFDKYFCQMGKSLDELIKVAEKLDLIICLENMLPGSGERFGSKIEHFLTFKREFACKNLGFCFDTGHAFITYGQDGLIKFFEAIKENIRIFHIQDNSGDRDLHIQPGRGLIDWKVFFRKISEIEISFPLTVEAVPFAHSEKSRYSNDAWKDMFEQVSTLVEKVMNL